MILGRRKYYVAREGVKLNLRFLSVAREMMEETIPRTTPNV
jgi:hypothetical protein